MTNTLKSLIFSAMVIAGLGAASPTATPQRSNPNTDPNSNRIVLSKENVIVLDAEFTDNSVAKVALRAKALDSALPSGEPIILVLISGGGSIEAGIELINNLKVLNRPVNTVTIFGASMAFQTVQGLGTRFVTDSGVLMSHKAKGGMSGEFPGQMDSRYAFYLQRVTALDLKAISRTNGKVKSLEEYRALIQNEYWCQGQSCVDKGFADKVVEVSCDKSLDGTTESVEHHSFMGIPIKITSVKANCPTITGMQDAKVDIKGVSTIPPKTDPNTAPKSYYDKGWEDPYKSMTPETAKAVQTFIENEIKALNAKHTIQAY